MWFILSTFYCYSAPLCCQTLLIVTQISPYDTILLSPYIRQRFPLKSWISSCPSYEQNYAMIFTLGISFRLLALAHNTLHVTVPANLRMLHTHWLCPQLLSSNSLFFLALDLTSSFMSRSHHNTSSLYLV